MESRKKAQHRLEQSFFRYNIDKSGWSNETIDSSWCLFKMNLFEWDMIRNRRYFFFLWIKNYRTMNIIFHYSLFINIINISIISRACFQWFFFSFLDLFPRFGEFWLNRHSNSFFRHYASPFQPSLTEIPKKKTKINWKSDFFA